MKKNLFLSLLFFLIGFLTHALFFPDILSNGFSDIQNLIVPNLTPTSVPGQPNQALYTKVTFDGDHFSKHHVTIGFTRYVEIINTSQDKLMWLTATTPELATNRGYGASEAVQMQANKKGDVTVADKNNPGEKLVITVK